jgi:hypothetical protein
MFREARMLLKDWLQCSFLYVCHEALPLAVNIPGKHSSFSLT